ncbi:hypothetical protein ACQY1Q_16455 [Tenacibaculum sp. TC6]|uniref:hypothetical protein n=1 Tax=Tenacibaculum sp. TC6 TaxID=3423223 RepID=UPI003D36BBAC
MKKHVLLLLFVFLLFNCSTNDDYSPPSEPDTNIIIESFKAKITSPSQFRDYSFYNQGCEGIFENPDRSTLFQGNVDIGYVNGSAHLKNSDIVVTWVSSVDGIFYQGNPNDSMETEIEKKLSKGVHTIYLNVSIPSKNIHIKDSITLSNAIQLTAKNTSKSVKLTWTKYEGSDFKSYIIYTEDFKPIVEINDINTLEYNFENFTSLVEKKQYQVIVRTKGVYEHIIGSNIEKMYPGIFIDFPYYIRKIISDPIRNRLYGLVGNKNYISDNYGLVIIDIDSQNFKVNSHILKDTFYTDFDISPDNENLFLSQTDNEEIVKLNLTTLTPTSFTTNTDSWGIHKIEAGVNNTLYCYGNSPTFDSSKFWIYDGNTGNLINGPITSFLTHDDIEYNHKNQALYTGKSSVNNGRVYKFNTDNTFVDVSSYPIWLTTISSPEPFILLAQNNQSLFWENYQLDLDLNIIRTFTSNIKACSPNNILLSDYEKVYTYNDLSIKYTFPQFPTGTSVANTIVFSDDDNLIFCRADQSNVKNHGELYYKGQTYIFRFKVGKNNF